MVFDGDDVRAIDERVDDLALLQIGRDEDVGFESGAGGVGGDGVGEVAGGRAATVSNPSSFERLNATLTTRSLNESVG